jgi:hypothetical protein
VYFAITDTAARCGRELFGQEFKIAYLREEHSQSLKQIKQDI